jgi:sensor histidine kinase YesM
MGFKEMFIKLKKNGIISILLLLMISLVIIFAIPIEKSINSKQYEKNHISFKYIEDKLGNLNLDEVINKFSTENAVGNKNGLFTFGNSKSTYWISIPLKEVSDIELKKYILIYNPTITKAVLYLPIKDGDKSKYEKLSSGWAFGEGRMDEGFAYPVFQCNENTDFEKEAYLELYSNFTQNYTIDFLSHSEFEQLKRSSFLLYGILYGILFSIAVQNIFSYAVLKEKANFYYFAYIISMALYQGCLLGVYNIFQSKYSSLFMANTITFSFIGMCTSVLFFRSFFRTQKLFPDYEKWLKKMLLLVLIGVMILLFKNYTLANLYAHTFSIAASSVLLVMAIGAYKKGFKPAMLFIIGWSFMIIGLVISLVRNAGFISNNVITINITFIAVTIQSILLSTALVQTVKLLMTENEAAIRQYYEAKEKAKAHELAFLQAQIKPHFLYNTLNVIISLCRIDHEKVRELLLDFSDYLHHNFDFYPEQKLVFLENEITYVQAYIRIEQARFPNKINVLYELEEAEKIMVPPLILQPLVENAIVHGIRRKKISGTVIIRSKQENNFWCIEVEDDGIGMTEEQIQEVLSNQWHQGKGVGIANINKRLLSLYGQGLMIRSLPEKGTVISFRILKGDE